MVRFRRSLNGPAIVNAVVLLVVVVLVGSYLTHRADLADHRAREYRQGICAVLDRIPMHADRGIDTARDEEHFDCGTPHPPTVFLGHPTRARGARSSGTAAPVVAPRTSSPAPAPSVAPPPPSHQPGHPIARPSRSPSPRPTPRPTPTPKPSPTCLLIVCLAK